MPGLNDDEAVDGESMVRANVDPALREKSPSLRTGQRNWFVNSRVHALS